VDGQGLLLAGLVVAGWSFPGVFVRLMPQLNPWVVAIFRLSIGFCFTLPVLLARKNRDEFWAAIRSPVSWGIASLMFGYYLLATAAFQNAPVGEVALLIASAPVVALPVRMMIGERPAGREWLGTGFAILGLACVLKPTGIKGHFANPVLGPVFALGAAFCAALFAISVRRHSSPTKRAGPLALSGLAQGMGLLALPIALAFTSPITFWDPRTLWAIPLGLVSTAIPTSAYAGASGRLPAVVATMINPLVAISANVVAAFAIGEIPRLWVVPGACLIFLGVYVSTSRPSTSPATTQK
jgi:drug/metabolite transporter, DME family